MTVFVEYVIIDNVVIDYLLLKATLIIANVRYKRKRLFLAALLGALIALVYPLLESVPLIMTAVKVLSGILLTLIATKYKSTREYYVVTLLFFLFTFLAGGAITGVFYLFNIPQSTELMIGIMILPVYAVVRIVVDVLKYLYRHKNVACKTYTIELTCREKTVTARGFFDTGNALYDDNSPVIVCGKSLFYDILGDNLLSVKLRKISVSTVSGKTENYAFKLDSLKIYILDKPNIYNNVTLLVSAESLGDGYDVILHPDLMEENVDENNAKAKKVS